MASDQECQPRVAKRLLSEEDKKAEKHFQPKKISSLKKRSDFLEHRKNCETFYGKMLIINYKYSNGCEPKIGYTVTKKLGSAVIRNRIKRVLRAIVLKNKKLIRLGMRLEFIPNRRFQKFSFKDVENDLKDIFKKIS